MLCLAVLLILVVHDLILHCVLELGTFHCVVVDSISADSGQPHSNSE